MQNFLFFLFLMLCLKQYCKLRMGSRILLFLLKDETKLLLECSGPCCCAIWWLQVCNTDAGKRNPPKTLEPLLQATSHIFPLKLPFLHVLFSLSSVPSCNGALMRIVCIHITSVPFLTL